MKTVRVLSRDAALAARLRRLLNGDLDLGTGGSLSHALEPGPAGQADVLLLDLGSAKIDPDELAAATASAPRPFLVALLAPDLPVSPLADRCDLALPRDLPDAALQLAIEQGVRMRRLELEVASLRRERTRRETAAPPAANGHGSTAALGTVLKELGKLLAAHFDIERVVEFFLDAITELVRPGRAALLLVDDEHRYRARGFRGLDPDLAERLRLESGEGLVDWFRQHVRLAARSELEREPDWLQAARELALLGGEVAVPLWVQAKLVGILVLGPRVTGQPYGTEDLERLFTLASQVAMAVEDIALFNTVRAQHGFIEQVLTHLQQGAITIDTAGRVTRFNRRAEQILELSLGDVLGQDLRTLPSPLGDLLYETMRGGRELRLSEVELTRHQATLEVSTSRILDAAGAPCGAVMLLDDPTPRHKLTRERQASQTLDLLNRVLLRLTDEIKNPLVSIYTFLELLPHRYEDTEFRETFLSVVGKDTQRLISLVDKLITLAGDRDYKVDFCDLRQVLYDALDELSVRLERSNGPRDAALFLLQVPERTDQLTAILYAPQEGLIVKIDREQLGKAIGYLVRFLANRIDADGRVAIHLQTAPDDPGRVRLMLTGRPAHLSTLEREHLFSPLAIASDKLLDVGPGVTQKIVEAHGGTLTLGGQEGEIRFVLTLPRTHQ
ncbi:MAG TPA: GAF domain-containing protein [Methylomirabilota bacterium]|jgi:PAS domain S-box-containing protein